MHGIQGIGCRVPLRGNLDSRKIKRPHRTAFRTLFQVKSPQGHWPVTVLDLYATSQRINSRTEDKSIVPPGVPAWKVAAYSHAARASSDGVQGSVTAGVRLKGIRPGKRGRLTRADGLQTAPFRRGWCARSDLARPTGVQTTMTKAEYEAYMESSAWKERAAACFSRDNGRCRLCDSTHKLQAHHRTYKNLGNEPPEDLTTLCGRCHMKFHGIVGNRPKRERVQYTPEQIKQFRAEKREAKKARKAARKLDRERDRKLYSANKPGFDCDGNAIKLKASKAVAVRTGRRGLPKSVWSEGGKGVPRPL